MQEFESWRVKDLDARNKREKAQFQQDFVVRLFRYRVKHQQ